MQAYENENDTLNPWIQNADETDTEDLLCLYRSMQNGPAQWSEHYPNADTIAFDLSRNSLFVMKNQQKEIIAAITIDQDEQVEALSCWSPSRMPGGEISRVCVRKDYQGKGIAAQMVQHAMAVMKTRGKKGIHLLVLGDHKVALRLYTRLGFEPVGECDLYQKHFLCMERSL